MDVFCTKTINIKPMAKSLKSTHLKCVKSVLFHKYDSKNGQMFGRNRQCKNGYVKEFKYY